MRGSAVPQSRDRALPAALVAAAVAVLPSLAAAPASAQVLTTERVPMRDGVELATDVWLPGGTVTARPVLLRRTPYGRAFEEGAIASFHALGYHFVSQDVRGRGDSDGAFVPFLDDARDGHDTIEWIAAQPWCNGRVGTFSGSAEGIVQLLAAGEAPPALRCAHVGVAAGDVWQAINPGGVWRSELTTSWLVGLGEPAALDWYRRHELLDASWDPARLDAAERARVAIPILLYGGLFDIFAPDTPRTHRLLQQEAASAARDDQFLVFGPWTHGGVNGTTVQGQVTFPADAEYLAFVEELLAFFGWCLQDGPRPDWAPVRHYVMRLADDGRSAAGEWRDADAWPPPSSPATLHLHDDGVLRSPLPAGGGAPAELPVDPAAPIPSLGGGNLSTPAGPFDQDTVDRRADVLVAQTPPAATDVELVGDVAARIWVSTTSTDGDVVVRLMDVTPAGASLLLADGARRGRFLGGTDAIRPLVPGAPIVFDVELGPVAFVLPAGHALRVAVQGTSSPRYEPNPGVAVPLADDPAPVRSTLTVYRDEVHPSAVVLPVTAGTLPGWEPGPDADADADADSDADADADVEASVDVVDGAADGAVDGAGDGSAEPTGGGGCGCGVVPAADGWPVVVALLSLLVTPALRRRSPRP
jgi:hypothetical protein